MSGTAEAAGTAATKRPGFLWIWGDSPLYDNHLMSEFKKSDPLHGDILQNSVEAKIYATAKGCMAGSVIGFTTFGMLNNRFTRTPLPVPVPVPVGSSPAQLLVRVIRSLMPSFFVCVIGGCAGSALGAHIVYKWTEIPHQAEAKFHDWLKNSSSAGQS